MHCFGNERLEFCNFLKSGRIHFIHTDSLHFTGCSLEYPCKPKAEVRYGAGIVDHCYICCIIGGWCISKLIDNWGLEKEDTFRKLLKELGWLRGVHTSFPRMTMIFKVTESCWRKFGLK